MAENVTTVERTTEYDYKLPDRPLTRLSWGGIWIGLFSTMALTLLFLSLGAAIGLTTLPGGWFPGTVGSGIWALVSFALATFIGAWIGTRASRLYFKSDALTEGFVIWAFSFVLFVILSTMATGFILRTTTMLSATAVQAAASAAQAGGQLLTQRELQALQQQLQSLLPGAAQVQQGGEQAATAALAASAVGMWWFFITGLVSLVTGIVGGLVGIMAKAKRDNEVPYRYPMTLRPQQRTV